MDILNDFLKSGVHGLDQILGGGFLPARLYLIVGAAGTGKTILGNQIAFYNVKKGQMSLFVTLTSESQGRMLDHIRPFNFYTDESVGEKIVYLSGFNELSTNGLEGFKDFLIKEIRKSKYKVVVIDGFNIVKNYAIDELEYSNFFHSLNAVASTLGCTIFLILSSSEINPNNEYISVDGVIELKRVDVGMRDAREIHVHKMRGISHYEGRHELRISQEGILIFPRAELLIALLNPFHPKLSEDKLSFGITYLDEMLKGVI